MSDFSKEREQILKEIEWCVGAIDYVYQNCDQYSEFFEPVSDAWLLVRQLKKGLENLFEQLELEQADSDTKKLKHE